MHTVLTKHEEKFGGWHAKVQVGDQTYFVGVERGKRVRIPFSSKWGHHWHGYVRDSAGKDLVKGRVDKGQSLRGLLVYAGLAEKAPRTAKGVTA